MRLVFVCLLCLQCLQGRAVRGDAGLIQDLLKALAASPAKTPLTRRHHLGTTDTDQDTWPTGVLLGAGLSAHQAEGAYNKYGKSEGVMDWAEHVPGKTYFPSNADVAADHYHRFREDLSLAKHMKFTSHRFSISWARVLPTGGIDNVNEEGVQFYKEYINEVLKNGLEPIVTMLHYDQPYSLENATGGWSNSEMVDKYVAYANFLFATFGDKVKYWNTVNEPNLYCNYFPTVMYEVGARPKEDNKLYYCMHNIILAHMKTYQLYKKNYQAKQKGKVGTSVLMWPATPKTSQSEDVAAAEIFNQMVCGAVLHPLVFGDYPPVLRYLVRKRDAETGAVESRLPTFTADEKEILAGGVTDFIALNVYSGVTTSFNHNKTAPPQPSFLLGPVVDDMPFVEASRVGNFDMTDEAVMHNALIWMWSTYHIPIIIAENGYGDTKHVGVKDTIRAAYHSANLRSLVRTMKEYDVKVLAYCVWSLLDLFEFSGGYFQRPFGLIHVDYETGSLNRTLKDSTQFFIDLNTTGRVPYVSAPGDDSGSSASPVAPVVLITAAAALVWLAIRVHC